MNETAMNEIILGIPVDIEEGASGLWFGTSPHLRGLLVAEHSEQAVREAIPAAISELLSARPL